VFIHATGRRESVSGDFVERDFIRDCRAEIVTSQRGAFYRGLAQYHTRARARAHVRADFRAFKARRGTVIIVKKRVFASFVTRRVFSLESICHLCHCYQSAFIIRMHELATCRVNIHIHGYVYATRGSTQERFAQREIPKVSNLIEYTANTRTRQPTHSKAEREQSREGKGEERTRGTRLTRRKPGIRLHL